MAEPYLGLAICTAKKLNNATINVSDSPIIKCLFFNDAMSSASFNSILALFCRIFKYKFGMNNKVVIKLSCVIGNLDINQSNRHYNAYWRGPNKEADEKSAYNNVKLGMGPNMRNWVRNFYRQCKLAGPQHREFRKEILQAMQVGEGQQI